MIRPRTIERLNAGCTCVTLDRDKLSSAAEAAVGDPAFYRALSETHPNLISAHPVFLSAAHADRMRDIIAAIETVAKSPAYRIAVLANAPSIAHFDPGPLGVFMGYDFHLGPEGPKLIEINTNAGGALINAYLMEAQRVCCVELLAVGDMPFNLSALLAQFVASFDKEWRRQDRDRKLKTIAIVDEAPQQQYLYPEFVLFQKLFESHGYSAMIVAPEALEHRDGSLSVRGEIIDLVYNRLTDFSFEKPATQALRAAYLAGEVVVTPNPRAHAMFANKANLAILTDAQALEAAGVAAGTIATLLDGIPRTVVVGSGNAQELWQSRDLLFFKPVDGFGGKAAYRGDKLTKKVWSEILQGRYVAQNRVAPGARAVSIDGEIQNLKADLRNYTYDGKVQLVAARLYQGQTTNMRTPGGGFAPVFTGDDAAACGCG